VRELVMEEDRKDRTVFVCVLEIEGRSEGWDV